MMAAWCPRTATAAHDILMGIDLDRALREAVEATASVPKSVFVAR